MKIFPLDVCYQLNLHSEYSDAQEGKYSSFQF